MPASRFTLAQFQDLLDRLGDDWEAWPVADRQRARRLLSRSPEAVALVAKAGELRAAVRQSRGKAPAGLADRIVAAGLKASPPKKRTGAAAGRKGSSRAKT